MAKKTGKTKSESEKKPEAPETSEQDEWPLPPTLYKYFGLKPYHFDVLSNREPYFADPTSFNDPFDCRLVPSLDGSPLKMELHLKGREKKGGIGW